MSGSFQWAREPCPIIRAMRQSAQMQIGSMSTARIPNLFIIGSAKAGTSALSRYLSEHPDIFMSEEAGNKEPGFYAPDNPSIMRVNSRAEYLALFEHAPSNVRYLGEASVNYLYSELAVDRILAESPQARLLVMVRNPVDIARARHSQLVKLALEPELDFEQAWRSQDQRAIDCSGLPLARLDMEQGYQYGKMSKIGMQLERVLNKAPAQSVHVVVFDDFVANTGSEYAQVLKFLGLDPDDRESFPTINPTLSYRFPALQRAVVGLMTKYDRLAIRRLGIHKILNRLNGRRAVTPLRPAFRSELNDYFRDDVALLSEILGRSFNHWVS